MNVLNNSSKEKGKRWVNTLSPYTTSNWEASSLKDNQSLQMKREQSKDNMPSTVTSEQ